MLIPLVREAALVTRGAADYDFFLGNQRLFPASLLTIFNPELFGTPLDGRFVEAWEHVVYFGGVTSLLALAGALRGRNRPFVGILLAGLVLSLALAVCAPLVRIAYAVVPGYYLFRLPARVTFLSAFFAFCLAGVGLDEVLSGARTERSRRMAAAMLIGLVALEGTFWARRYLRASDPIPFAPTAEYTRVLADADQPARIAPLARSIPSYGSAAALGLQLVTGYDSFNLRYYQTYMDILQDDRTPGNRAAVWTDLSHITRFDMLAALNVLYLVAPERIDVPADEYALVASFDHQAQFRFYEGLASGPVQVYRNQRPLGRAFFVSRVVSAADERAAVADVLTTDLRETAVVPTPTNEGQSVRTATDRVDVREAAAGRLDLSVRNTLPRFLVISEVWNPGWRARVDGNWSPLTGADLRCRACGSARANIESS